MTARLRIIIDGEHRELVADEDTTHDGDLDSATIVLDGSRYTLTDLDGDGIPDLIRVVRPDDSRYLMVCEDGSRQYRVVSDSAAHDDSVEEDASHWFAQATNYTCGPAAITMVLADLLNLRIPDETAVWQRALDHQVITQAGMRPDDIGRLISSYGIPSRLVQSDTQQLEQLLELGHEVILMVDADEYWPGHDGRGANDVIRKKPHAVRVLGIDHASGIAIVSDSGRNDPLFRRLDVPLDHLNDAWADLEWLAVVTEITHHEIRVRLAEGWVPPSELTAPPRPRTPLAPTTEAITIDSAPGSRRTVFLPFTVRLSRLVEAVRRQQQRRRQQRPERSR